MTAVQRIVEQLVALKKDGELPEVAQIDLGTCDESPDVIVYAHLADEEINGGCPLVASIDLAAMRAQFETAIVAARALHNALQS